MSFIGGSTGKTTYIDTRKKRSLGTHTHTHTQCLHTHSQDRLTTPELTIKGLLQIQSNPLNRLFIKYSKESLVYHTSCTSFTCFLPALGATESIESGWRVMFNPPHYTGAGGFKSTKTRTGTRDPLNRIRTSHIVRDRGVLMCRERYVPENRHPRKGRLAM